MYDDADDIDDSDDFHVDDDGDHVDDVDYNDHFSGKVRRLLHHHQCLCSRQNSQVGSGHLISCLKSKMTNGVKCFFNLYFGG